MKKAKAKAAGTTPQRAASRGKRVTQAARPGCDPRANHESSGELGSGYDRDHDRRSRKGYHLALKYLFERIGLYPTTGAEDSPGEDSQARTLLRRLGFPEDVSPVELKQENPVTKDTAQDPSATPNDVLE
jgi:hypothetical protein